MTGAGVSREMKGPVSSSTFLWAQLPLPLPLQLFLLLLVVGVSPLLAEPMNCSFQLVGRHTHYFDNYDEIVYDASCGHLCPLPSPVGLRNVTELRVQFPPNRTLVNCSWVTPALGDPLMSVVMYFESFKPVSLAHDLEPCANNEDDDSSEGSGAPSLTLWDQYADGGEARTSYTICKHPENPPEVRRWSSRLGGPSTLITLTDFPVPSPEANPMLLKYLPVNWSEDCFAGAGNYKDVEVYSSENMTALGGYWLTSHLRFPNGMRCNWKLSTFSSSPDLIRLRITVLDRTSLPGPCARDDTVKVRGGDRNQTFTLCDDSGSFFFYSLPSSSSSSSSSSSDVTVEFTSGQVGGAPEWQMWYLAMPSCPVDRLWVETDTKENVLFGVLEPTTTSSSSQFTGPCRWTLHTNWTNNVVMVTRLEVDPPLRDCPPAGGRGGGGGISLTLDLGSTLAPSVIDLCETPTSFLPLWSYGLDLHVDLSQAAGATSRRTVSVTYKSVTKVADCQDIPGQLEAVVGSARSVLADLSLQRTYRHVSAPDCRWLVYPAPQGRAAGKDTADHYVAEVTVSSGGLWQANSNTARWLISGFRAYAGGAIVDNNDNDTSSSSSSSSSGNRLKEYCFFDSHTLLCRFVSTQPTLLLVYNPALSASPTPLDRVSLSVRMVKGSTSGGQPGPRVQQRLWGWLGLVLVVMAAGV